MPDRTNYPDRTIVLAPGRYKVFGFPPMTGLMLNKWIDVNETNHPGCYGEANIAIDTAIPNLVRIEDEHGDLVWSQEDR